MNNKIKLGQFFTKNNPFDNSVFDAWFSEAMYVCENKIVLEPFAGNEDIIKFLKNNYTFNFKGFDISPKTKKTTKQNTIQNYPKGFDIAITNPPYLAKNSSTRKGWIWLYDGFDDLYKVSLNKMLENNKYVAAIVPATLITSGLFKDRLSDYILLNTVMFDETDVPVCLALFKPLNSIDFRIWELNKTKIHFTGTFYTIKNATNKILKQNKIIKIKFNDIKGEYGVLATDKSYKSIKFVAGKDIPDNKIKNTSRNIIRFSSSVPLSIPKLNKKLNEFIENNGEIFLAPFKNLRNDNKYRRRLDFNTIKRMVQAC